MFEDEIYLDLSKHVYSDTYTVVDGYEQVIIPFITNDNGYVISDNFACAAYKKGNKVIITFRGTDDFADIAISDFGLVLDNIPRMSFANAQKFYIQVLEYFAEENVEIEFAGHSLGGAIAQLMGAKYGHKTVTFNAPGMLNMLNQIGCSSDATYDNITNYSILNDYVGNFRAHVGDTYYIAPIPVGSEPLFDTHNGIFAYTEATHGEIFSKIQGFESKHALALWAYDEKNTDIVLKNSILTLVSKDDLREACTLVEQYLGNYGKLPQAIKCFDGENGYLIGSNKSDVLMGKDTNDIIWGNQEYDNIRGLGGNDQIFGGGGNDVICGDKGNDYLAGGSGTDYYWFYTGDGQDTIAESDEWKTSYRNVAYYSKLGFVLVDNKRLTGGEYSKELNQYLAYEPGITYQWSGINNSDLKVFYGNGDSITIRGFKNGDLGINFDRSITLVKDDIINQLIRNKQIPNDLLKDINVNTDVSELQYFDTDKNIRYDVINCETTEKIINAYGNELPEGVLDSSGKFMLVEEGSKIALKHTPVDTSSLVKDMQDAINGNLSQKTDIPIQQGIYIPTSSEMGSPTLKDVYYIYTSKPSGGNFLSALFTLAQMAVCLVSQNWWGAAFVALETGAAGKGVAKAASIASLLLGIAQLQTAGVKNLSGVINTVSGKQAVFDTVPPGGITGFAANIAENTTLKGAISYSENGAANWLWNSFAQNSQSPLIPTTSLLNLLVNTNTNPQTDTSEVYIQNAFTGTISGNYQIPTSNIMDPDTSTPDVTLNAQISVDRGCPLVLDLAGDGVDTLNIDNTDIYFNTMNSDFLNKTGWISKDDAFLAIDKDNDGKITRQDELFGTETLSGFDVLKNYDTNNDGIIDAADTQFSDLKIWQDLNENGITNDGELKTLADANIASINLDALKINDEQNNNTITGMSTFTKTDGTVLHIYNVNLAFNKIYTQYNGNYELSTDVLDMV